eukprot:508518-Hanusia_phi.AAC.1
MAVGLFGDIGETLSQKCMTFHPRGNTISGVENGDVYIWSNGVVNAKIEKAHKKMVTSVKWVEDVGLFTCGVGGLLKIWDPDVSSIVRSPKLSFSCPSVERHEEANMHNRFEFVPYERIPQHLEKVGRSTAPMFLIFSSQFLQDGAWIGRHHQRS